MALDDYFFSLTSSPSSAKRAKEREHLMEAQKESLFGMTLGISGLVLYARATYDVLLGNKTCGIFGITLGTILAYEGFHPARQAKVRAHLIEARKYSGKARIRDLDGKDQYC
jgi:hypothetical protein